MTHAHVRPARHTNYSTELMVNVRRIFGYHGICSCGWEGQVWAKPSKAQAEAKWHYWTEHSDEIAARRREEASPTGGAEAS